MVAMDPNGSRRCCHFHHHTAVQCALGRAHTHMSVCFHMNLRVPWCVCYCLSICYVPVCVRVCSLMHVVCLMCCRCAVLVFVMILEVGYTEVQ